MFLRIFMLSCVVFGGGMIAGAQGVGVEKMDAGRVSRVVVTDFGAVPDSRKDATGAIGRALAACKEAMAGGDEGLAPGRGTVTSGRGRRRVVLVFPRGRYDLFPDSAVK